MQPASGAARSTMHVLYLHGFASSADSSKGRLFAERLSPLGVDVTRLDLNEPDFSTLTATRMIDQVERARTALAPGPHVLIGSSLGGFVAWHVAARAEARGVPLQRLVLMAPALDFGSTGVGGLGEDDLARWRATGWREFVHHAYGRSLPVHYALHADARQYDSARAIVTSPALVFQGRHDAIVDPAMVERFVAGRPNVTLRLLDDDHQLHASLDAIWSEAARFLGVPAA
jgi:pimeloyl-ACP methyl ester carboxylesterase